MRNRNFHRTESSAVYVLSGGQPRISITLNLDLYAVADYVYILRAVLNSIKRDVFAAEKHGRQDQSRAEKTGRATVVAVGLAIKTRRGQSFAGRVQHGRRRRKGEPPQRRREHNGRRRHRVRSVHTVHDHAAVAVLFSAVDGPQNAAAAAAATTRVGDAARDERRHPKAAHARGRPVRLRCREKRRFQRFEPLEVPREIGKRETGVFGRRRRAARGAVDRRARPQVRQLRAQTGRERRRHRVVPRRCPARRPREPGRLALFTAGNVPETAPGGVGNRRRRRRAGSPVGASVLPETSAVQVRELQHSVLQVRELFGA